MKLDLQGVDHVHVEVADRDKATTWYHDVMGLSPVERLKSWADENGPLTVEDPGGSVHLALFERKVPVPTKAVAYGTSGAGFLRWKKHLEDRGLDLRIADHTLAFSVYFSDPWGNQHEITTYDHDIVSTELAV